MDSELVRALRAKIAEWRRDRDPSTHGDEEYWAGLLNCADEALSPAYWSDVRAELLRLAARVKELELDNEGLRADRDMCLAMRDKYMGELAALKAKIAEAPVILCVVKPADSDSEDAGTFYMPPHLWNKTLALLDLGKEG